jgi:hypothetical protein
VPLLERDVPLEGRMLGSIPHRSRLLGASRTAVGCWVRPARGVVAAGEFRSTAVSFRLLGEWGRSVGSTFGGSDNPGLVSEYDELDSVAGAEFGKGAGDVGLDCGFGDVESVADFGVVRTAADQNENFEFPGR